MEINEGEAEACNGTTEISSNVQCFFFPLTSETLTKQTSLLCINGAGVTLQTFEQKNKQPLLHLTTYEAQCAEGRVLFLVLGNQLVRFSSSFWTPRPRVRLLVIPPQTRNCICETSYLAAWSTLRRRKKKNTPEFAVQHYRLTRFNLVCSCLWSRKMCKTQLLWLRRIYTWQKCTKNCNKLSK